jgi:metal-dependent hydrolase (beta-lactamase superfamily II)
LLDTSGSQTVNWSEYLNNLISELQKRQCSLQEILISHWHPDHTDGVKHIFKSITKGNNT